MLRVLVILALLYVIWCTVLYLLQDQIAFPANLAPSPRGEVPYPGVIELTLDVGRDAEVLGWLVPAPEDADRPAPVVVYFHGNAEIIDYQDEIVAGYRRLGCAVFLPEYRGYGRSGGKPSRDGIRDDCVQFYDLLARRPDVDGTRVVFHGYSLGGAVAADLAAHRKPRALILQATFTSAQALAHRFLAPGFLVRHRYQTDQVVANLDIPMLIIHGINDVVIPVRHGRKLRQLARQGTYVEYDCGHVDLPDPQKTPSYWREIASFLSGCGVIEAAEG